LGVPNVETASSEDIKKRLAQAKELAQSYRKLTGKPLGVAGEAAEFEAQHLGLELVAARQAGYDAVHGNGKRKEKAAAFDQGSLHPARQQEEPAPRQDR
jgi:hypothetical protein